MQNCVLAIELPPFDRHPQGFGEVMKTDLRSHRFIVILDHEMRSSLAAIRVALDKWRERSPSELDDLRHLIERQLRVLTRLSEDLLNNENSADFQMALNPSSVVLGGVLAGSVEQSRPLFEQRAQRLSLGAIDHSLEILGDTDRLTQVFSNLLQNASKFTPIEGAVYVSLQAENDLAVVRIVDTGKGITPNELDTIFEKGAVPDGCCYPDNEGFGVGLELVRTIVAAHGGSILAKSDGARLGSEFVVKLPLAKQIPNVFKLAAEHRPASSLVGNAENGIADTDSSPLIVFGGLRLQRDVSCSCLEMMGRVVEVSVGEPESTEISASSTRLILLIDLDIAGSNGFDHACLLHERSGAEKQFFNSVNGDISELRQAVLKYFYGQ
jgi:hypothetical protein